MSTPAQLNRVSEQLKVVIRDVRNHSAEIIAALEVHSTALASLAQVLTTACEDLETRLSIINESIDTLETIATARQVTQEDCPVMPGEQIN